MRITLQFYAMVRERLRSERAEIEVPDHLPVGRLRALLAEQYPAIADLLPRLAVAVDHEYSPDDLAIRPGAVVALIPPIAGGAPRLRESALDLDEVMRAVAWPGAGAIATFTGTVRNLSRGRPVEYLEYEAYPEMAEAKLAQVEAEVRARWPMVRCAVLHRVGRLEVGEAAVVIAVASPHRPEAFAACSFAIDHLKATVPLWKKETGPDGSSWVEECVPSAHGQAQAHEAGAEPGSEHLHGAGQAHRHR